MKKFKNAFDYDHASIINEINTEPSETVPEMTMSLKELLRRYTRGSEVATLTPQYQENPNEFDENPDFQKMDALEKLEFAHEIKQAIKERQNEMAERKKQPVTKQVPTPKTEDKPEEKTDPETDQKP